jgi:putative ABC transport system permease protein
MILEILIAFIVVYIVMTVVVFHLSNFLKPLGFSFENVWAINMDWGNNDNQEVRLSLQQMGNVLRTLPEVENFAFSESFLFTPMASSGTNYTYEGREVSASYLRGSDQLASVMGYTILKGRWFNNSDDVSTRPPLVISRKMEKELFQGASGLGKIILEGDLECQIIGIIADIRNHGELTRVKSTAYRRINIEQDQEDQDFLDNNFGKRLLVKTFSNMDASFEERMMKALSMVARNFTLKSEKLSETRIKANHQSMILPLILAIICGFLVINVALGLFGIIWYNTTRRRAEIGLRRALGSTRIHIYRQIVGEALVLCTFSMILGSVIVLQIPILGVAGFIEKSVYFSAFALSIVFIYGMAILCALHPSFLAAKISPAEALHEE